MYTEIDYYYRDAANYKAFDTLLVEGQLTPSYVAAIEATLQDGEFFIPADLRLPQVRELQSQLARFPTGSDHVWHTLCLQTRRSIPQPAVHTSAVPVATLVQAFADVQRRGGWDVDGAMRRIGLRPDGLKLTALKRRVGLP